MYVIIIIMFLWSRLYVVAPKCIFKAFYVKGYRNPFLKGTLGLKTVVSMTFDILLLTMENYEEIPLCLCVKGRENYLSHPAPPPPYIFIQLSAFIVFCCLLLAF